MALSSPPPVNEDTLRVAGRLFAVADFNGDGAHDLLVASTYYRGATQQGSLEILFGDGAGAFVDALLLATYRTWSAVNAADLNGDGLDDVYALASSDNLGHSRNEVSIWITQTDESPL